MSARDGLVSQPGPSMPTRASVVLIAPWVGCINSWKRMPTPMVETSTGKNTTERKKLCANMPEVSSTASKSPRMDFSAEVRIAKTSVLIVPRTRKGSEKN